MEIRALHRGDVCSSWCRRQRVDARDGGGAFHLELVQVDDPPPAVDPSQASPGTAHLAFTGIDVAEVFDRMTSLGYRSLSQPVSPSSGPNAGGLLVYLLDPDGNRVELMQPPASDRSTI